MVLFTCRKMPFLNVHYVHCSLFILLTLNKITNTYLINIYYLFYLIYIYTNIPPYVHIPHFEQ